jgi:hypothetical protein
MRVIDSFLELKDRPLPPLQAARAFMRHRTRIVRWKAQQRGRNVEPDTCDRVVIEWARGKGEINFIDAWAPYYHAMGLKGPHMDSDPTARAWDANTIIVDYLSPTWRSANPVVCTYHPGLLKWKSWELMARFIDLHADHGMVLAFNRTYILHNWLKGHEELERLIRAATGREITNHGTTFTDCVWTIAAQQH